MTDILLGMRHKNQKYLSFVLRIKNCMVGSCSDFIYSMLRCVILSQCKRPNSLTHIIILQVVMVFLLMKLPMDGYVPGAKEMHGQQ